MNHPSRSIGAFGNDAASGKPIMTAAETSHWLGFASVNALLRARKRGLLPIEMFQLPGRRGWFAATRAVVGWAEASTRAHLSYQTPEGEGIR